MAEPVSEGVDFLGAQALRDAPGAAGLHRVEVTYLIGDRWRVTLVADVRGSGGSDFTQMSFEAEGEADSSEGINSGLLRLIPFRHAKTQVDDAILKAWSDEAHPIPDECTTPAEYAAMAVAYQDFAERFPQQPLKKMEDLSNIPKSTLSARVNKAKVLGYLDRDSRTGPYRATAAAWKQIHG